MHRAERLSLKVPCIIVGSQCGNLCHFQAPLVCRWRPDFWMICVPLVIRINKALFVQRAQYERSGGWSQCCYKTHTDVWHRTMGLRQQLKYCHPTKMSIKNTPICGRCATVRIKLHASQRSRHPIHQKCPTRKKHQTSRPLRGTSQCTSAAISGKAKQPKAKKTLTDRPQMKQKRPLRWRSPYPATRRTYNIFPPPPD